jgi:FkbM family methyltransferase
MRNRIFWILKAFYRASSYSFFKRIKLILSVKMSFFLPIETREGMQLRNKQEVPPYVDNFLYSDIIEPIYLANLKRQHNPIIIDLGCNTGVLAEYFFKLAPNSQYYMFDMMKECIEAARDRLSGYGNSVRSFNLALGDENKDIDIAFDNPMNSGNTLLHDGKSSNKRIVPMRRLDEVAEIKNLSKIDLMKIDVEGYELQVLRGALETIKKCEFSIIELHLQKDLDDYSEFVNIYASCGLHVYKIIRRNLFFKKSLS